MKRAALAVALLVATACGSGSSARPDAASRAAVPDSGAAAAAARPVTPVRIAHQPPSAKDIIDAVLASSDVPLSVSPTCEGMGTEPSDKTIGRYLAGFLAELSSPARKNWIETNVAPGRSAAGDEVSVCRLTLRHEDGDDRWGWGVQFQVRTHDGAVLPDSFTCLGAG